MKTFFLLALIVPVLAGGADKVDIYWIDVEGGASTLVVTESGHAVLMDAGYPGLDGRDAKRIERVVKKEAGLDAIDYFITSHFHRDHVGGLKALAKRIEIREFLDHGDSVDRDSPRGQPLWEEYVATTEGKRRVVKPGDRLDIPGVELVIVAAHSRFLEEPLSGGESNELCAGFERHAEDTGENGKSTGYLLAVGDFEFVNLGDLSWNFQNEMACPVNLLGEIDLFQVTHHGGGDDVLPQQMWALKPTVAVMNNGPRKGAGAEATETVMRSPGLEDLWQLHLAVANDREHNTDEERIANLTDGEDCEAHWIHARLHGNGTYTLTNSRNGHSKTYRTK